MTGDTLGSPTRKAIQGWRLGSIAGGSKPSDRRLNLWQAATACDEMENGGRKFLQQVNLATGS
jgi:hypothetical protein